VAETVAADPTLPTEADWFRLIATASSLKALMEDIARIKDVIVKISPGDDTKVALGLLPPPRKD
jgi:hypothetical protein